MTNEEKVNRYKQEIESVFETQDALSFLERYDNNKEVNSKGENNMRLLHLQKDKTYFVKFKCDETNPLSMFLKHWIVSGKSIAGVKAEVMYFDENDLISKEDIKNRLLDFINKL